VNRLSSFFKKNISEAFSIFGDFLVYRCAGLNFINGESPYGVNQLQNCLNSNPKNLGMNLNNFEVGLLRMVTHHL
jgi:hypothetical protein